MWTGPASVTNEKILVIEFDVPKCVAPATVETTMIRRRDPVPAVPCREDRGSGVIRLAAYSSSAAPASYLASLLM